MTTNNSFFELVDGCLSPCENRGYSYRVRPPSTTFLRSPIPPPLWRTKRELRRLARANTRGRRGALSRDAIAKKHTQPEPVYRRIPSPIEMVGNTFRVNCRRYQLGIPEELWPKESWNIVIYAQNGTNIPQQVIDQATTALLATIHGRVCSADEALEVIEYHAHQTQQERDWERCQAWVANGRHR